MCAVPGAMGGVEENDSAATKFEKDEDDDALDLSNEKIVPVDLRGRPVDKSKTGSWKSAPFFCVFAIADFEAVLSTSSTLVPYLVMVLHQSVSDAATITTNFFGTCSLLAVLGGFISDSYLGSYRTLSIGIVATSLGLGLLVLQVSYDGLQPDPCVPGPTAPCPRAGTHYMAPLYVALYTLAFGSGLVKPNNLALGADQFDESSKKERKQSTHFFAWFYFASNIGLILAFTLFVYLQQEVSRSWGYGFSLLLYAACAVIFYLGTPKMRHRRPAGSFLTRLAQVLVAALGKWKARLPSPDHTTELYNAPLPGVKSLPHSNQLRFLDKAAVVADGATSGGTQTSQLSRWKLCSVTQVEEAKRLISMIPIWVSTFPVSLVFGQLLTFTVQAGSTLDRKWNDHFELPPASLSVIAVIFSNVSVPVYDRILFPLLSKFTGNPYGVAPLKRLGASIVLASLTMVAAALVERKRVDSVRDHHFEALPLGAYTLPLSMWWLIPVYFIAGQVEFFLFVSSYQFFYHESSGGTRSIGTSFTYASAAMGNYLSTVVVKLVNRTTRHQKGGSWLKGQLNNGGLEKYYWLLAVLLAINFFIYLVCAYCYKYKYDWHHTESPSDAEMGERKPKTVFPENDS